MAGLIHVLDDATGDLIPVTDVMLGSGSTVIPAPGGGTHDFASGPLTVTLADGTEVELVLQGVALPRSIAVSPVSGDTVRLRFRYTSGGAWFQPTETLAITNSTSDTGKQHSLDRPVYSMGITRTAGSGTTSVVVIA